MNRLERRLRKKAVEKEKKKIISGMNPLQRFVLNGLQKGTVTVEHLEEMAAHYVTKEAAIDKLDKLDHEIINPEDE